MTKTIVGIIGGSGVYNLEALTGIREEESVATPWGEPSDRLRLGRIGATEAVFLARHGRGHRLSPSGINYRANIDALKRVGVTDIISLSACGSFKREFYPGLFVLVDQFDDRTHRRETSFFGNGCVAHVSMAHPVAPRLQRRIAEAAAAEGIACQLGVNSSLHRGAGSFLRSPNPVLSGARRRRHRHDRSDRGQACARARDFPCDRCDDHRFRLLARGAWRGRCRSGWSRSRTRTRNAPARWCRACCATCPPSTSLARSAQIARSTTPS